MDEIIRKLAAVEGWAPLLYVEGANHACEEAGDDVLLDDPRVVRVECWFIAGEQYLLTKREDATDKWSVPELGEYELDENGRVIEACGAARYELEECIPAAKRALTRGAEVHPLLADLARRT